MSGARSAGLEVPRGEVEVEAKPSAVGQRGHAASEVACRLAAFEVLSMQGMEERKALAAASVAAPLSCARCVRAAATWMKLNWSPCEPTNALTSCQLRVSLISLFSSGESSSPGFRPLRGGRAPGETGRWGFGTRVDGEPPSSRLRDSMCSPTGPLPEETPLSAAWDDVDAVVGPWTADVAEVLGWGAIVGAGCMRPWECSWVPVCLRDSRGPLRELLPGLGAFAQLHVTGRGLAVEEETSPEGPPRGLRSMA